MQCTCNSFGHVQVLVPNELQDKSWDLHVHTSTKYMYMYVRKQSKQIQKQFEIPGKNDVMLLAFRLASVTSSSPEMPLMGVRCARMSAATTDGRASHSGSTRRTCRTRNAWRTRDAWRTYTSTCTYTPASHTWRTMRTCHAYMLYNA